MNHRERGACCDAGTGRIAQIDRRALVWRAASGLVLAAGALYAPIWLEQADAREGAYGGQLGGRHGRNQRGRNKSKDGSDTKNGAPRGSRKDERTDANTHVRWITFNLYNDRPAASPNPSVTVVPWARFADWGQYPGSPLPNGRAAIYRLPGATESALIVDGRFYVGGINYAVGTPQIILARDGTMNRQGYQNADGRTIVESLGQGEQITRTLGGGAFSITRITDSGHYIEFDVHFT